MKDWEGKQKNQAKDVLGQSEGAYAYRAPWWFPGQGWCHAMSWGSSHPLRRAKLLVAVHRITSDPRYLAAAYAALDFHNGCNPNGMTLSFLNQRSKYELITPVPKTRPRYSIMTSLPRIRRAVGCESPSSP